MHCGKCRSCTMVNNFYPLLVIISISRIPFPKHIMNTQYYGCANENINILVASITEDV